MHGESQKHHHHLCLQVGHEWLQTADLRRRFTAFSTWTLRFAEEFFLWARSSQPATIRPSIFQPIGHLAITSFMMMMARLQIRQLLSKPFVLRAVCLPADCLLACRQLQKYSWVCGLTAMRTRHRVCRRRDSLTSAQFGLWFWLQRLEVCERGLFCCLALWKQFPAGLLRISHYSGLCSPGSALSLARGFAAAYCAPVLLWRGVGGCPSARIWWSILVSALLGFRLSFTVLRAPCLSVTFSTARLLHVQGLSSPSVLQDCMGLKLFALPSRPWLLLQPCGLIVPVGCVRFARVPRLCPVSCACTRAPSCSAGVHWLVRRGSPRRRGSVDTCTL